MRWSAAYEARSNVPHFVYIAWGADRRPLYVGCTSNIERRMKEHRHSRTKWYSLPHTLTVMEFPTRDEALEVESRQIWKLRPMANVQGNPRHQTLETYGTDDFRPLTIRERKAEALRALRGGAA